jgi:hypothetical protein
MDLKYLPWEDESREEFQERSNLFGLKYIQYESVVSIESSYF